MGHICRPHVPVLGEIESHCFAFHIVRYLDMGNEPVSHSVIICSEDHGELLELQGHLVEDILHFRLLIYDSTDCLVHAPSGNLLYRLGSTEYCSILKTHPERRLVQKLIRLMGKRVIEFLSSLHSHDKFSIRRFEFIIPGCS